MFDRSPSPPWSTFIMPLPNGAEWIVILIIALLILGPGKLPDVASAVGKSIREFRKASSDVQEAVKVDTSPLPPASAPASTPAPAETVPPPVVPDPPVAAALAAASPPPMPAASVATQAESSDATAESR
jgi:TatA/E family protein of Tat protein translocase